MSVTPVPLVLTGIPDNLCFEGTFAEAIIKVLSLAKVMIPSSITNVVVGPNEPSDSQRDYVWYKTNAAGDFIGVFIFAAGAWNQISPVPYALTWVYGDSNAPSPGYLPANDPSVPIPAPEQAYLESLWFPVGAGPWTLYQAYYVGF